MFRIDFNKLRFLVCDDNPHMRRILRTLLHSFGAREVYEAEDGQIKIDVRLEDETVWLTQQLMADLFQTTKQNIGQHLKNVFSEGELLENSVVKKFFTTAADGKKYKTNFEGALGTPFTFTDLKL